jgi:hypothetical protein
MRLFSIKRAVVTIGAVAALAVGTGALPGAAGSTPTAQAAELAQPAAGPHGPGGQMNGSHMNSGHNGIHLNGGGNWNGHRSFFRPGFSHNYWGWGYHRFYPQYYTTYVYEPVNVCSAYYFDDDDGVWYCFTGY